MGERFRGVLSPVFTPPIWRTVVAFPASYGCWSQGLPQNAWRHRFNPCAWCLSVLTTRSAAFSGPIFWLPHWPLRASLATFCLLQNVTSVSSLWFSFCLISKQPLSRPVSLCVYSCRTIKVNFGCFWQRSNTLLESSRSSRYILETSFRQCSLVFKHVPPDQVRGFMVGVATSQ